MLSSVVQDKEAYQMNLCNVYISLTESNHDSQFYFTCRFLLPTGLYHITWMSTLFNGLIILCASISPRRSDIWVESLDNVAKCSTYLTGPCTLKCLRVPLVYIFIVAFKPDLAELPTRENWTLELNHIVGYLGTGSSKKAQKAPKDDPLTDRPARRASR